VRRLFLDMLIRFKNCILQLLVFFSGGLLFIGGINCAEFRVVFASDIGSIVIFILINNVGARPECKFICWQNLFSVRLISVGTLTLFISETLLRAAVELLAQGDVI
jgi:hypothetical protein